MKRLLLAASALVIAGAPIAASAQEGDGGGRRGGRGERAQGQQPGGGERQWGGGRERGGGEGRRGGEGDQEGGAGQGRRSQEARPAQEQRQVDQQAQQTQRNDPPRERYDHTQRRSEGVEGRNPDGSFNRGDGRWSARGGRTEQPQTYVPGGRYNPDGSLRNGGDRDGRDWRRDRDGRGDRDGRQWRGDRDDRYDGRRDGREWRGDRRGPGTFQYRGRSYNRYRAPAYRWAPGWSYRRWGVGSILPSILFAREYVLSNFWDYGLPPPPPGAYWLRVDQDVYLITRSGRVLEYIPNVFFYDDYYGW